MKITKRQILLLLEMLSRLANHNCYNYTALQYDAYMLINEINDQQSDELIEVNKDD